MALSPDIVAGVSRRLVEHAGLELPAWVVEARALARIAALDVTPAAYVELISTARGAAELRELLEVVRVGESSLFRHRSQIAVLTEVVAPALRERGRRAIRVWSAGCASGEEPYTLAVVLARALPGIAISIVATDVSDDALAVAAGAAYPIAELADVPDDWRDAFIEDGACVRVRPELAQLVRFERANLLEAAPPRNCDLVWCRNVLIYFSAAARRRAIERLVAATVPGGFVFVGYSESLREITELEAQRAGDAVFYVKRGDWSAAERTPVPELRPREQTSPGLAISARDQRTLASAPARREQRTAIVDERREGTSPGIALPRRDRPVVARREGTDPGVAVPPESAVAVPTRTAANPALALPRTGTRVGVPPARPGTREAVTPRTPPAGVAVLAAVAADETVLVLTGAPDATEVTTLLGERLAIGGLRRLTLDLDTATMLEDELATVIRRACAAARGAGVDIVIRATRTGAKRWVSRHGLDEVAG